MKIVNFLAIIILILILLNNYLNEQNLCNYKLEGNEACIGATVEGQYLTPQLKSGTTICTVDDKITDHLFFIEGTCRDIVTGKRYYWEKKGNKEVFRKDLKYVNEYY